MVKRKILFAGIDGTGKSTCLELLISKLDWNYRILRIGYSRHYICFRGDRVKALKHDLQSGMESLERASKKYHFYPLFLMLNFLVKYSITKYLEIFKRCDIIVYETDTLLHPAVHIAFHFPWSRSISERTRFRISSALFGAKSSLLIAFLDADPEIAMARIRKRAIPIDAHENPKDLAVLRSEFQKIVAVAAGRGLKVVSINTDNKSPEGVVDEIRGALEGA
jgi:broad-specificity NMP kinase